MGISVLLKSGQVNFKLNSKVMKKVTFFAVGMISSLCFFHSASFAGLKELLQEYDALRADRIQVGTYIDVMSAGKVVKLSKGALESKFSSQAVVAFRANENLIALGGPFAASSEESEIVQSTQVAHLEKPALVVMAGVLEAAIIDKTKEIERHVLAAGQKGEGKASDLTAPMVGPDVLNADIATRIELIRVLASVNQKQAESQIQCQMDQQKIVKDNFSLSEKQDLLRAKCAELEKEVIRKRVMVQKVYDETISSCMKGKAQNPFVVEIAGLEKITKLFGQSAYRDRVKQSLIDFVNRVTIIQHYPDGLRVGVKAALTITGYRVRSGESELSFDLRFSVDAPDSKPFVRAFTGLFLDASGEIDVGRSTDLTNKLHQLVEGQLRTEIETVLAVREQIYLERVKQAREFYTLVEAGVWEKYAPWAIYDGSSLGDETCRLLIDNPLGTSDCGDGQTACSISDSSPPPYSLPTYVPLDDRAPSAPDYSLLGGN